MVMITFSMLQESLARGRIKFEAAVYNCTEQFRRNENEFLGGNGLIFFLRENMKPLVFWCFQGE